MLAYEQKISLPPAGMRVATLGPLDPKSGYLSLRTELETKTYTDKLARLLYMKDQWDLIRRRVCRQIGRRKGHARDKRRILARLSWDGWVDNHLHVWTREIADWLRSQEVGTLRIASIDTGDWPCFKFKELLRYKLADYGIASIEGADVSEQSGARAARADVAADAKRIKKRRDAWRELNNQLGE